MGKRTPATTRSTYIRATEPGGTKMPASEHRYSSADQGMYGITMPSDTRQSSNYAVQGTSLMQWEDYEGGIWHDTGRTLGPQDYEPAAVVEEEEAEPVVVVEEEEAEPVVTTTTTEDDDDDDHQVHQSQSWDSYATTEETQAMSEAETARVTRKKLLEEIEARRKLRLKKPRKYGRFSLISNLETGLPSLLSG